MLNDCCSHLTQEVMKLNRRLNYQKKHFEGLANCLYDRIKKLNDEVTRQHAHKGHLENVIRRQQQEIGELTGNRPLNIPLKWQICHNLKIEESNILKIDDYNFSPFAFAQSYYSLKPAEPFFQIQLPKSPDALSENVVSARRNLIWIGLTRRGHPIVRSPEADSIACIWNGRIQVDKECLTNGPRWEDGDLIKCGIKFPKNFMSEGNNTAVVCLYKNEKSFFEKSTKIPLDGFFPTICIYGRDTRVTYINN